jgi:hypothetical protein
MRKWASDISPGNWPLRHHASRLVLATVTETSFHIQQCNDGTLPSLIGWWTNLTRFEVPGNTFQGTIPSAIGAWTSLTSLNIGYNKLTGTIPSTVSAWTALSRAYFGRNNINGSMPTFGGGFCPRQGIGLTLDADCNNITGQAKISCACCNVCL